MPAALVKARGGVYLAGGFYAFRGFGSRLGGAEVGQPKDTDPFLRIGYSYDGRYGRQSAEVSIPVPPGKETEAEEAEEVAAELNRAAGRP